MGFRVHVQGPKNTKMEKKGFCKMAIKWARRGVRPIVGCRRNPRNILKTLVMIRIGFGRIFDSSTFSWTDFSPQIEKNPNQPDVMEFFLAKKGREKKSVQNRSAGSQFARNRLGNMI